MSYTENKQQPAFVRQPFEGIGSVVHDLRITDAQRANILEELFETIIAEWSYRSKAYYFIIEHGLLEQFRAYYEAESTPPPENLDH